MLRLADLGETLSRGWGDTKVVVSHRARHSSRPHKRHLLPLAIILYMSMHFDSEDSEDCTYQDTSVRLLLPCETIQLTGAGRQACQAQEGRKENRCRSQRHTAAGCSPGDPAAARGPLLRYPGCSGVA